MTTDVKSGVQANPFLGNLTIAFIVLKLVGVIDWPWVWVVSPLWLSLAILLVVGIITAIVNAVKQ